MATLLERRIDAILQLLSDPDAGRGIGIDEIVLGLAHETGIDPTNPLCWQILMAAFVYVSEHLGIDDFAARQMKRQGYNTQTFAALTKQTQPGRLARLLPAPKV